MSDEDKVPLWKSLAQFLELMPVGFWRLLTVVALSLVGCVSSCNCHRVSQVERSNDYERGEGWRNFLK